MLNQANLLNFPEIINPDTVSEVTWSGWTGDYFLICNGGQVVHLVPNYSPDAQNYAIIAVLVEDWGYEDHMDISSVVYKRSLPKGTVIEVHEPEVTTSAIHTATDGGITRLTD